MFHRKKISDCGVDGSRRAGVCEVLGHPPLMRLTSSKALSFLPLLFAIVIRFRHRLNVVDVKE
jgi:hypothetical protein